MSKYTCEKCGKEFKQKGHYKIHLNKKKPCINESQIKEIVDNVFKENVSNIINNPEIKLTIIDDNIEKFNITEYEGLESSKNLSQKTLKFID